MTNALAYIALAVVLYLAADRILDAIERSRGRRFEERTLVFFFLLLALGLIGFSVLSQLLGR
jgi:predicted PurR-regulated permease PerM